MAQAYTISSVDARGMGMQRVRLDDPVVYPTPKTKRIDTKFTIRAGYNEIVDVVEKRAIGEAVRVKNTTGSTINKGAPLSPTGALSTQTSATAVNNPLAGASVVINVAATFEVGQQVSIVSGGKTDYALVTAVSAGASVTVDMLFYDHTTPVVTALPAYIAQLATANGSNAAEWVPTADIANNAYGWAYSMVEITGMNTSGAAVGDFLYLLATGGVGTSAPTGSDQVQQIVGQVKTVHAATGVILYYPGLKRILKIGSSCLQAGIAGNITGAMAMTADITPTVLAANTDNWAPTDFATSAVVRVAASSAINLTGIAGGADGKLIILHNVGAETITLKDETTSTAANRFALDADDPLQADQSRILYYDATSARWRVIGKAQGTVVTSVTASGVLSSSGGTTPNITLTGIVGLANGGTGANLSATGGANQFVRQNSAGGVFTVSAIAKADLPAAVAYEDEANTFTAAQTFSSYVVWTPGSPTTLAADVNDYDFGAVSFARLSSDAARVITGLANGVDGRMLVVANVGASPITLSHESVSSTGANRITMPTGANVDLAANYGALLIYDGTSARWRMIAYFQVAAGGGGNITGTGTSGRVARFTGTTAIADGIIRDDGTNIGINTAVNASYRVDLSGKFRLNDTLTSTVSTGTAPLIIASTTEVDNLNVSRVGGQRGAYTFKNVLMNGAFDVWQRGTSFAAVANGTYTADRWYAQLSYDGVATVDKTADSPTIAESTAHTTHCMRVLVTTQDSTVGAAQYFQMQTHIEGYIYRAIAQRSFTLSFWVKGNNAGTYVVALRNSTADRSYLQTFAVTTSWSKVTINVAASPSAGTWDYTTGSGLAVAIVLMCGTDNQSTTGSWLSANKFGVSGMTNFFATAANDIRFTQMQIETGDIATNFDRRDYATEVRLCQRYYFKTFALETTPAEGLGAATNPHLWTKNTATGASVHSSFPLPVPMRTTPTIATYSPGTSGVEIYNFSTSAPFASTAANTAATTTMVRIGGNDDAGAATGNLCGLHFACNADF